MIYEMLYGFPPFYSLGPDGRTSPQLTYGKVLAMQLAFPKTFSVEVKDLITKLLQVRAAPVEYCTVSHCPVL